MEDKFKVPVANKCIIRSTGEEVEVIAFNLPVSNFDVAADLLGVGAGFVVLLII